MTILSAVPKQSSEFPTAFYASLVSATLYRYSLIEHIAQNLLYQVMQSVINLGSVEASFQAKSPVSID